MLINLPPYNQAALGALSAAGDPLWDRVVLLMHMEAAENSTALLDERGHVNTGNAKASSVKKKFGNTSARHEGVGYTINFNNAPEFDLLAKDFCVEAWVNLESTWRGGVILGRWGIGPSTAADYIFLFQNNGSIETAGVSSVSAPAGSLPLDGNWHHLAFDRFGNTLTIYVNGVIKASGPAVTAGNSGGRPLRTGMWDDGGTGFVGYMDELRFTNGLSRYRGSAFAPPTAAFPHKKPVAVPLGGTWNTAYAAAYSNDNKTAALGGNAFTVSTNTMSAGIHYFEVKIDDWARNYQPAIGIVPVGEAAQGYAAAHGRCIWGYNGSLMGNGGAVITTYPELVLGVNDRLGVLVDFTTSTLMFYKNGAPTGVSTTFDSSFTYVALGSSTAGISPANVTLLPNATF